MNLFKFSGFAVCPDGTVNIHDIITGESHTFPSERDALIFTVNALIAKIKH